LNRLAESIDRLAEKDDSLLRRAHEIGEMRRAAAMDLHDTCARFVVRLNTLLSRTQVSLDPGDYTAATFREEGQNLFQIHVRGRVLQAEFSATPELVSTENFRVPYILEGTVRCFNQQLLEQDLIREHLLFYCLEKGRGVWRYFDERTYHSGPADEEYLAVLLEELV
jgi:hypothetical protein